MIKELLFSAVVSAVWLAICFLLFGIIYISIGLLIDASGMMQFERAWGSLSFGSNLTLPRLPLYAFGAFMVLACLPMNYYWLWRIHNEETMKR